MSEFSRSKQSEVSARSDGPRHRAPRSTAPQRRARKGAAWVLSAGLLVGGGVVAWNLLNQPEDHEAAVHCDDLISGLKHEYKDLETAGAKGKQALNETPKGNAANFDYQQANDNILELRWKIANKDCPHPKVVASYTATSLGGLTVRFDAKNTKGDIAELVWISGDVNRQNALFQHDRQVRYPYTAAQTSTSELWAYDIYGGHSAAELTVCDADGDGDMDVRGCPKDQ